MTAKLAEPVEFPKPRDPSIQDRVEATAEQIHIGFPYRTLLECRQLAARLVDEVMCWDALWPEAEGDCACTGPSHRFGCVWDPQEATL